MIEILNFTLLPEGTSDRALLPILQWVLSAHVAKSVSVLGTVVDAGRMPWGAVKTPAARVRSAVDLYPCQVLFIHRDADNVSWVDRKLEITGWHAEAQLTDGPMAIPVIPVRMSEAWLLIDEAAIRRAAGNPGGTADLHLPKIHELEGIADPKRLLFDALTTASDLQGRRRKKFDRNSARAAIGNFVSEMRRLRHLSAFQKLEGRIVEVCRERGWN